MCLFVVSCLLEQRAKQMSQREKPSQVEQTSEVPRRLDAEAEEHQQHASRDHRQVEGELVVGRVGVGQLVVG